MLPDRPVWRGISNPPRSNLEPQKRCAQFPLLGAAPQERVPSSLYSGRMLKSFELGGAVRISPLHCHVPDDIAQFLAITGTLTANR
ncbi:hypothetical protein [Burkholderia sp. IMCC1007]|uniref:hypothetical protein n=1 Tax=Burkholderia sp. IMCC1007 TaxID=3004104 RepID=UPI003FA4588C